MGRPGCSQRGPAEEYPEHPQDSGRLHCRQSRRPSMKSLIPLFVLTLCAFGQEADLAVVQKIAGSVGFYTRDGKFISDVKVGEHPHEAVLSPDKRLLYV